LGSTFSRERDEKLFWQTANGKWRTDLAIILLILAYKSGMMMWQNVGEIEQQIF